MVANAKLHILFPSIFVLSIQTSYPFFALGFRFHMQKDNTGTGIFYYRLAAFSIVVAIANICFSLFFIPQICKLYAIS